MELMFLQAEADIFSVNPSVLQQLISTHAQRGILSIFMVPETCELGES